MDFHVIINVEIAKGEIMIPLLSEDFAAFHIENFLTMTDVYCGLYDEEYTKLRYLVNTKFSQV